MITVLVADDDPVVRGLIIESLKGVITCEIIEAKDGSEALSLAILRQPHLIIMDLHMPEMNGIEVCKSLRQIIGLQMPLIVISAYLTDDTLNLLSEYGVN